jgi:integrase
MGKKLSLTQAIVAKLGPPETGRTTIHDAKARGLILTITSKGTKSYSLYRRVKGKPARILLGHHPAMSVELARDRAVQVYAEIIGGADPNEEKRAQRSGGLALGDVFDHFLLNRVGSRGSSSTATTHKSRFDTCLEDWRTRRIDGIRRDEVVALHVRLGKERGHTTANRAVQLLRSLFNYAATSLRLEVQNPAARVEMFKETARERFLRADELPKFFKAVADEPDETFRDFFVVALFTGARRGNVQAMRWADVNLESATWIIPAEQFKTRRPMSVVLSGEVLTVLRRRKKYADGEYVFPSHGKRGHLVEPKGAWDRLRERSGLADLRIHDLRRTLGSWQAAGGSSLPIIGKSLGHTQPSTTAIYARLDLDAVRESVAAATAAISAAGKAGAK